MAQIELPPWYFMGGSAEFTPAGEMDIVDDQTQQQKHITWRNHIKLMVGRRVTKLRKAECIAIVELMKDKSFREKVEQC